MENTGVAIENALKKLRDEERVEEFITMSPSAIEVQNLVVRAIAQ